MKNRILNVLMLLVVTLTYVSAQDAYHRGRRPQKQQHERIRDGYRHGDLTPNECRGLHHQQREFRIAKRMAACDGKISKRERKELRRLKHRNDRSIYRERHDREFR